MKEHLKFFALTASLLAAWASAILWLLTLDR